MWENEKSTLAIGENGMVTKLAANQQGWYIGIQKLSYGLTYYAKAALKTVGLMVF